ncbi:hypothetical protein HOY80DRAFT_919342 [Tuber brumale]|nr:hypothetical protein HOY80DRAFT_919342 [Tuber brumale]
MPVRPGHSPMHCCPSRPHTETDGLDAWVYCVLLEHFRQHCYHLRFESIMPLPETITEVFELVRQMGETDESQFYGPFNILPNHVFWHDKRYMVVLQYKRPTQLRLVNFTTIFLVRYKTHPVFFVKVKFGSGLHHISSG